MLNFGRSPARPGPEPTTSIFFKGTLTPTALGPKLWDMKFDIFNPPAKLNLAAYRPRYAVCAIDPVEQRARHA